MATRRRRMTAAQRRACLRNLRKARAALRRKHGRRTVRRAKHTTRRRTHKRSASALHRIRSKAGRKGNRLKKFHAELRALEGEDYSAMSNPFRKGKLRKTVRRIGTIFKRKGRTYIVSRLRNGVKVARPWSRRARK